MLLPRELFSALYHHYPVAFGDKLAGSPGALRNFWKDMDGSPRYAAHPVRTRGDHNTYCAQYRSMGAVPQQWGWAKYGGN